MNYGLVLSGGGSRAAFGLGAVKYFEEIGLEFKAYSGASGGAIATTLLASGLSADESFQIIKNIDFKQLIKFNYFRGSLFRYENEKEFLDSILPFKNFEELEKPLFINAVDFNTGETTYFHRGDLLSAVLASCALFPVFKPHFKDGSYYIDGGFTNNLPYEPLENVVDKTIAINVNPVRKLDYTNLTFWKKLKRVLALMFYANIATRIHKVDIYIEPPEIGKFNFLDVGCLDKAYGMGYEYVKKLSLENIVKEQN